VKQVSRKAERGNSIIEFVLSFSLLFAVFTGVFQFGYSFYLYNKLQTAMRSAACFASRRTYDSSTSTPTDSYIAAVRNMAVYGNPDGGTQPVISGLTPSKVSVNITWQSNLPAAVTVRMNNYTINGMFMSFTLSKPVATFPYVGRYAGGSDDDD
jgi:Flp pilus assembly protein TadG